jgi:uncharacterized protein (DUF433 family)
VGFCTRAIQHAATPAGFRQKANEQKSTPGVIPHTGRARPAHRNEAESHQRRACTPSARPTRTQPSEPVRLLLFSHGRREWGRKVQKDRVTGSLRLTTGRRRCHNEVVRLPAITQDPDILLGSPVFRGTRVELRTLFDYLVNHGRHGFAEFLADYPKVSRGLAIAALEECGLRLLDENAGRGPRRCVVGSDWSSFLWTCWNRWAGVSGAIGARSTCAACY